MTLNMVFLCCFVFTFWTGKSSLHVLPKKIGGLLVTPALAVACVLMILIIRAELALYLHNICRVISHWAAAAPMLHSVMLHSLCAVATGSVVNVLPDCHSLLTAISRASNEGSQIFHKHNVAPYWGFSWLNAPRLWVLSQYQDTMLNALYSQ